MIPVPNPLPEPDKFDTRCRVRGIKWLKNHPNEPVSKVPSHWREFQPDLAEGFSYRCGWTAMHIGTDGAVDHYLSKNNFRDQIYEWSNYRYSSTTVNSSKQAIDQEVLDPFEVETGWFEVRIPSLELVVTDLVPKVLLDKAEFTIGRLNLGRGEKVIANRRQWYRDYCDSDLSLERLERYAPLVAGAIRKWLDSGRELPKI